MKKKFTGYTLLLMLLNLASWNVLAQKQVVSIDGTQLKSKTIKTEEVDFSKGFDLDFRNFKVGTKVKIEVTDDDGVPRIIKNEAIASTGFIIPFNSINGQTIGIKLSDNSNISISPVETLQLFISTTSDTAEIFLPNKVGVPNQPVSPTSVQSENFIPGIELHDAIMAKKFYDSKDRKLFSLLARVKNSNTQQPDSVRKLYAGNDFILKLIPKEKDNDFTKDLVGSQVGAAGFITKVLSTDVTTFADGLARFLVKRTKEELNVAFFQRFKDLINSPEYLDAQILFPMTMETLNAIDQEIYQFENYITTLREAFEKDLSLLLENLPTVIEEGKWSNYFSKPENNNRKYSLLLTLFTAKELLDGVHPGKVLETLPDDYIGMFLRSDNKTIDLNISGAFKTAQLISASLRSQGSDKYWSSLDSIQMLYKNDVKLVTAKFYLGFLYEKDPGISFQSKSLRQYLSAISDKDDSIMTYIAFVKDLGKKYHTIESAIAQIKLKSPETPSIDVYNRLFRSFADALDNVLEIDELPGINVDGQITGTIKKYINLFKEGNDLALNVVRKNYGSAVINTYNIYLVVTDSMGLNSADSKIAKQVKEFIKKYGTFMANTVKAKTSEEVAAAIEAVALPVGSASIKRQTNFNISLNAYVGLFLGSENIKGVDDGWKLNSYGVTAPIGIAVSFRNSKQSSRRSSSSSIFFSIIDLGAPVSFRFKDDKTEEVPSIEFKDIISPGVFYSFGIPRVPISVNAGWQLGPLLREVDPQYTPGETYSRISLSIVVDIPLLNFYTKNR